MYKSIRQLKKEANVALSGRRGIYILMLTVSMTITSLLSMSGILSLVGSLFTVILQVGMYSFLLKLSCGLKEQAQFNDLFYAFKGQNGEAGKAILLYLLQTLYILPAVIIYFLLMMLFIFMEAKAIGDLDVLATLGTSVGFVVFVFVAFIAFFIYSLYISITYVISFFVLLDYPELTTKQIWKRAFQIIKGHRLRYVGLEFSYLLWYILPMAVLIAGAVSTSPLLILLGVAAFVFCILWMVPSMQCAISGFYLDLVRHHARPAETVEETPVEIVSETDPFTQS